MPGWWNGRCWSSGTPFPSKGERFKHYECFSSHAPTECLWAHWPSRYPEHFVQCEFSQLGAHGGLCQLCDGVLWILHTVTGLGTGGRTITLVNLIGGKQHAETDRDFQQDTLKGSRILRYSTPSICSVTLSVKAKQTHSRHLPINATQIWLIITLTYPKTLQTALAHRSQSLWDSARSEFGPGQVWESSNPAREQRLVSYLAATPLVWNLLNVKQGDTGSKMRWKRPILSTTQASCWGTKRTTVFMGRLDAHRCWAGVTHNFGTLRWLCCTETPTIIARHNLSSKLNVSCSTFRSQYLVGGYKKQTIFLKLNNSVKKISESQNKEQYLKKN